MMDFQQLFQSCSSIRIKTLSSKADSGVFLMERQDGSCFVLRVYHEAAEVYTALIGHTCSSLPKVYGTYSQSGLFCVEEEYIDGISLQEMVSGGARFDEKRTCSLTRKICQAAAYLHACGFIHRDVKPEHVLLTPDGRVLLIDLDAAMSIERQKCSDTRLLGTAIYAAPEQFGLTRSDERSDIYAIGILMNELLTGVHPAVTRYRGGELDAVIERCTQMNPADRYQTISELEAVLHEKEDSAEGEHSVPAKPRHTGKLAGLGLAAVLAFAAVLLPGFSSDSVTDELTNPPAEAEVQQVSKSVQSSETELESVDEPEPEAESDPEPEPETESKPEPEPEPQPEDLPAVKPQKSENAQKTPEKPKPQKAEVLTDEKVDAPENSSAPEKPAEPNDGAARVEGTDYLQLYKERQGDTVYFNFRTGSQSAPLFTEEGILVDETWNVYADKSVGIIEKWDTRYSGWTLRSERCEMGAAGYIHAEKDGKHYAIKVMVMGEPMSAYWSIPSLANYKEGYIQPRDYPELGSTKLVKVEYRRGEPLNLYLVAMKGFREIQPVSSSSLVAISPCSDALAWNEPVFNMTFFNPEGGDALIEVTSKHNNLQFYFSEIL